MKALLRAEGLVKHFPLRTDILGRSGAGTLRAVDGVSFEIPAGGTLALVGESGCGKSTTGRLVLRLIEPTAGRIWFDGCELLTLDERQMQVLRRKMQIIFQDPYGSLNPRMTVADTLTEPLVLHRLAAGKEGHRVAELLNLVGLAPEHAGRYPHQFSGGQRQRIGIARALAVEPRLIVCDEPVSALDVSIQAQIINLLQDLQERFDLAYLFISHDLAVVRHIATRVAVMYLGKIVESADTAALFDEPRHPYTRALLSAVPVADPTLKRERLVVQGDAGDAHRLPAGCRFHPRCPYARERCRVEEPAMASTSSHGVACHFWPELDPWRSSAAAAGGNPRLERLQTFFRGRVS